MTRRRTVPDPSDLGAYIEQLDGAALRDVIVELSAELEPHERARLVAIAAGKLVKAKGQGALPAGEDVQRLSADVSRYARSPKVTARGNPSDLDALFARLNATWMRGEHEVFRMGVMEIAAALESGVDLGHDELYSEVLSTDVYEIARRLLVSVYLTSAPDERPAAISESNDAMDVLMASEDQPIRAMEAAALEPLPDLDDFARAWTAHLRAQIGSGRAKGSWAFERQLREATSRSAGTSGLAELARGSKASADYEAWAAALRSAGDWGAAAEAAREGALANAGGYQRANLFTLAARIELGRGKASEPDLKSALLADPRAVRLRRWLASVPPNERGRAIRELELDTEDAAAKVILHALSGDWLAVAKLLATGAPLGWSGRDHPGDVGVDVLTWALAPPSARVQPLEARSPSELADLADPGARIEEDVASIEGLEPLPAPTLTALLDALQPPKPTASEANASREAMSTAALARVDAVAESARRSRYEDAARLVALAAALHTAAGDTSAAASLVSKARGATGRKWSFTQAIDRAVRSTSRR